MEKDKLVQVSEHSILINFTLNTKCRTTIHLKSLSSTSPVTFKLQTSSPHKFLVNPPSGTLPPLATTTFQIILKPQFHLPSSFPRSPSDKFLLKAATASHAHDVKLKVYFVGPFLLSHALATNDIEAVKGIVKRQRFLVDRLPPDVRGLLGFRVREDGRTALWRAVESGDRRMVEVLMEGGADPTVGEGGESCCRTVVDVARDNGHMEIVNLLERGEAVLHAARRGELEVLESLLEKGANMNFCDQYGLTALHVAAIKGNKYVVMMLIEFGANMECQDAEGHTPLHLAVEGGSIETVEVLINRGADIDARSKKGATPLYISRLMEYEDITQLLLGKGAVTVV